MLLNNDISLFLEKDMLLFLKLDFLEVFNDDSQANCFSKAIKLVEQPKMETHSITGSKAGIVWFFICIFFLVSCAKAENTKEPTWNQNLTPFEGWRSAVYCLRNHSDVCPAKHTLDESGWLNVTHEEGEAFCKQGCADHTRAVLTCIQHVKRDYWFANKATLKDLSETINIGCDTPQGFNGTSLYPSNGHKIDSAYMISALSALVIVALY